MNQQELVARLQKQLGNLDEVAARVQANPSASLDAVRPKPAIEEGLESMEAPDEGVGLMLAGANALKKVSAKGAKAKLTPQESLGLEAIILTTGRPAILVQDNKFGDPPPGWEVLATYRAAIQNAFPSVGRIDADIQGTRFPLGTGFVVGKNIIMTNRHVAKQLAEFDAKKKQWMIWKTRSPFIDWYQEKDRKKSVGFRIKRVIGIHDHKDIDLALLEIEQTPIKGKAKVPAPLLMSKKPSKKSEQVYAIGYPKVDQSGDTPAEVIRDIFGDALGVKRLQPGENDGSVNPRVFAHDCSTLNGSSGSCIFSMETGKVIGLHFQGTYKKRNDAVALWKLQNDPLVKKHVTFD